MASGKENTATVDFAATTGGEGEAFKKFDLDLLIESVEKYQFSLDEEGEKRDAIRLTVRGIDKTVKKINFLLLDIHRDASEKNLLATGQKGVLVLERDIHPLMQDLAQHVPQNEYYKYNDIWRHSFQRLATVACTIQFLLKGTLCPLDECATMINLPIMLEAKKLAEATVFLDYDEYLVGLLEMGNELSRLCRNCITFGGSTATVFAIHDCLNELNAGMHYITFKNDYLRKRYDGLKYHLKIVEEVVYDLKIRKLEEDSNLKKVVGTSGSQSIEAIEDDQNADKAAGDAMKERATDKKEEKVATTGTEAEEKLGDSGSQSPKAKKVASSTQVLFRRKDN